MEKFKLILKEKDYLIKSAIKKLKIYKNYEDFYQIGSIALYKAYKNYDKKKDLKNNFDLYAYYIVLNYMKNEIKRNKKSSEREILIDLYNNEYLIPIVEDKLIDKIIMEDSFNALKEDQKEIIKLRYMGYKIDEIANIYHISVDQVKYKLKKSFAETKEYYNNIKDIKENDYIKVD